MIVWLFSKFCLVYIHVVLKRFISCTISVTLECVLQDKTVPLVVVIFQSNKYNNSKSWSSTCIHVVAISLIVIVFDECCLFAL